MKAFKFITGQTDEIISQQPTNVRNVEGTAVTTARSIRDAVVIAINACNLHHLRYEEFEISFYLDDYLDVQRMKLRVMDIRKYRNPIYSFYKIHYKMARWGTTINEHTPIYQRRFDEPDYYRLIHQTS